MKKINLVSFTKTRKLFVLFILLSFQLCLFGQANDEANNPWFLNLRSYPKDTIPQNAFADATIVQQNKRTQMGYFDWPGHWISIGPSVSGSVAGRGNIREVRPELQPHHETIYLHYCPWRRGVEKYRLRQHL